jgi:ketosteroid isomerase-like protein
VSLELDSPATRTLARGLIDDFAKGWSKANVELLASVFAEEAVFLETPFVEPLRGLAAIKRYWSDVPFHQSEITVTTGEIYVAGPWFSTEFRARFRRRRTGDWVDARGAIFAETAGGKVSEMRMYWHRSSGGKEIFDG